MDLNFYSTGKPPRMLRSTKHFTKNQSKILLEAFQSNHYLKGLQKVQLAKSLNISRNRIDVWFHNKRYEVNRREGMMSKRLLFNGEPVYMM